MQTACSLPTDALLQLLIEHNPNAVRQKLAAFGISTTGKETALELLQIVKGLYTSDVENNIEISAQIFSIAYNKEAANAELVGVLAQDSLGAMVFCNVVSKQGGNYKFVEKKELKTLQIWATTGVILGALGLLMLAVRYFSPQN